MKTDEILSSKDEKVCMERMTMAFDEIFGKQDSEPEEAYKEEVYDHDDYYKRD